jgi:poly(hydroxyalkanoate) depolymerase family esterase
MRKMSDTIARLAAMRVQGNVHIPNVGTDRLSAPIEFGSNPGALKARVYIPQSLAEGAPLVVVLHGCTQNAAGYDYNSGWSQLADQAGFALLFPEQQRANNPNLCFNWFQPGDAMGDSGEARSIRQMIEKMVVTHGLDRKRIFVTGLSAGGAMAAAMLAVYPDVFAGGGIIAGLPYGVATTIPEAFDRMRGHGGPSEPDLQRLLGGASTHTRPWPTISIWQGSADHTVAPSNAEAVAGQLRGVHQLDRAPTYSKSEGGRTRNVWCDHAGEPKVEVNMIAGMGHGTPLGDDGLGAPGPFMLEVGVSSTREIARFWGISNADGKGASVPSNPAAREVVSTPPKEKVGAMEPTYDGRAGSNPPNKVQKIIEDALRAAGLLK